MDSSARNSEPALDRTVLQSLDACRPSSDDAAQILPEDAHRLLRDDPRYAAWYEQSTAFDEAVAAIYADVSVPDGLAERLRAALEADRGAMPATVVESPAPLQVAAMNRRRWLTVAGSTLATTAAAWGLFTWWRGRQRDVWTTEELLHEVLALHQHTVGLREAGVPISRQKPPAALSFSDHVRPEVEPRWRMLNERLLERAGVAYELTAPAAPRAVLYVLALQGERGSADLPPLATDSTQPPATTGGCSLGAWREGERLIVLVVDGDERRYRAFVERPAVIA